MKPKSSTVVLMKKLSTEIPVPKLDDRYELRSFNHAELDKDLERWFWLISILFSPSPVGCVFNKPKDFYKQIYNKGNFNPDHFFFIIDRTWDLPVAVLGFEIIYDKDLTWAHLKWGGVLEKYRRMGFMTALFTMCLNTAYLSECECIIGATWEGAYVLGIYKKLGFKRGGLRRWKRLKV